MTNQIGEEKKNSDGFGAFLFINFLLMGYGFLKPPPFKSHHMKVTTQNKGMSFSASNFMLSHGMPAPNSKLGRGAFTPNSTLGQDASSPNPTFV